MLRKKVRNSRKDWLTSNFGSKKGFVLTHYYRCLSFFGAYKKYTDIDWNKVERIVFICKGNICRSAYADVIAAKLGLSVASCGVHARESAHANNSAIEVASLKNVNLKNHRTTPLKNIEFKSTDLFLAMEPWQVEFVNKEYKGKCMITLLGLWGDPKLPYIQDPYGLSHEYFDHCFDYIQNSVDAISRLLTNTKIRNIKNEI